MSFFFGIWALLLIALVTRLIYKGYGQKSRVKKVEKDVKTLHLKVDEVWQKIKEKP